MPKKKDFWPVKKGFTKYLANTHTQELHVTEADCPHAMKIHPDHRLYVPAPLVGYKECKDCFGKQKKK